MFARTGSILIGRSLNTNEYVEAHVEICNTMYPLQVPTKANVSFPQGTIAAIYVCCKQLKLIHFDFYRLMENNSMSNARAR